MGACLREACYRPAPRHSPCRSRVWWCGRGGGAMPSTPGDISLAVGDGTRRMTYAELAQARAISLASARRFARRHRWPRQVAGRQRRNCPRHCPIGTTAAWPSANDRKRARNLSSHGPGPAYAAADGTDPGPDMSGPGPWPMQADGDPRPDQGTDPLSRAVDSLREQLAIANRRIDELQAALTEERRLLIAMLVDRRPWWRRWFR